MSDLMEAQLQKPPIVIAIRNDAPFPIIQVAPRSHPKDLHKASESCHQVELPKALKYRNAAYYTDVADDFLDNADFEALAGLDTGRPDPSIVLHSNESDVARSIDETINRVIALVLLGGHPDGTLTMSSTTQRYNKIDIPDPEPYEPSSITCIPDWTAACAYTPEPGKEQILSNLVLEYKDRGLVFTKEFESEMQMTQERLVGAMKEFAERGNQVSNSIATNSGNDQAVASADTAAQALRQSNVRYKKQSTLGRQLATPFTPHVTETLHQSTSYAITTPARFVGFMEHQSLIMFEFEGLTRDSMSKDEITRLRAGPGQIVSAVVVDNPAQIRRVVLGAWLRSIHVLHD
ncbi:hypothetical protein CTAM01_07568 [Colletotrichum tamarilloi]|uniref:Uncharacterized protein n=1 Tax=Colletotrichum tamarilloi TaxID=1209934 RepID=A0ABQ9R880_9PEZI|nr:uncharacterized protein CTAM01_07568 [Colletotrichum tamarilloi]KAK1497931.1 hypothetical protein CTAM01_07568 [Colletotrichum tamarilloi]